MMPDDPQDQRRQYEQAQQQAPADEHEPVRPVEDTEVPDAVEAASTEQKTEEPTKDKVQARKARGVDWVRPTDLMARSSAAMAGRGIDLQTKLAKRVDRGIATGVKSLASAAAKKLPPLSSFGRGRTHVPPTRSAVGRN